MTMTHTELHTIHNPHEAEMLAEAGLPHIDDLEYCYNCGREVGCVNGKFVPLAVVLNDTREWFLCTSCAGPAIGRAPVQIS